RARSRIQHVPNRNSKRLRRSPQVGRVLRNRSQLAAAVTGGGRLGGYLRRDSHLDLEGSGADRATAHAGVRPILSLQTSREYVASGRSRDGPPTPPSPMPVRARTPHNSGWKAERVQPPP